MHTDFTERNNSIGYVKPGDTFIPVTNFTFRFECKVLTTTRGLDSSRTNSSDYNGFLVEVKTSGIEEKG